MAELGALSLKIEAIGDKQVLSALNAIESRARVVDKTATDAVAALKALGISAKTVGNQVAVAAADMDKATAILTKMGNTAKVVSREHVEAARLEANANRVRTRGFQEYLNTLTKGAALEKTRADAIRQLIALESALQKQLQQTNLTFNQQVQLSTTLGRVQTAIASGIETTTQAARRSAAVQTQGFTVLGQAATTTSGRLSAFSTRAISGLNAAAFSVSTLAAGGAVSFRTLAGAASGFAAFFGPGGAIASIGITAGLAIADFFTRTRDQIDQTKDKALQALRDVSSAVEAGRRTRDPASVISKLADDTRELQELTVEAAAIAHRTEAARTQAERDRLVVIRERIAVLQREIAIGERAALSQREAVRTGALPAVTVEAPAGESPEEREKKRRDALAKTVQALAQLHALDRQQGGQLVTLAQTYAELHAELKRGNVDLARRAEIESQLATLRKAEVQAVAIGLTGLSRRGPAQAIRIPPSVAERFREVAGATVSRALSPIDVELDVRFALAADVLQARLDEMVRDIIERVKAGTLTAEQGRQLVQQAQFGTGVAQAITQAMSQGLTAGLQGANVAETAGRVLSQATGQLLTQTAAQWLAASEMMAAIQRFFVANPVAAVAASLALLTLGQSLGGGTPSMAGGAGLGTTPRISSAQALGSRLIVDPNAAARERAARAVGGSPTISTPPPPQIINVIGYNTPRGQAMIGEASQRYRARGGG